MTAILALYNAKKKTGAIAADSRMSASVSTETRPKIKRLGPAFVASAGSPVGAVFLESYASGIREPADVGWFAKGWRDWCTSRRHFGQDESLRSYPAMFIVLAPHGLYEVLPDGEVFCHPDNTRATSIGSGTHVCMGAAHVMLRETVDYDHIARWSVEAAIDLLESCGGPVQVCEMGAI